MLISVVIPVYNESGIIGGTLEETLTHLQGLDCEFEILCVDDGSQDGSAQEVRAAAAKDGRIRLHELPANRGKGAAVRTGVLEARGDLVFFLDADLSTPLSEVSAFLPHFTEGVDIIIGNRKSPRSKIDRRQPFLRESLGRIFTLLSRLLLAPEIEDFTCGFKGFRAEAAREVFRRSTLDGWAFDAELVVIARARGYRILQLPITWSNCPKSKVRVLRAVIVSLLDLGRLFSRRVRGTYRGELAN